MKTVIKFFKILLIGIAFLVVLLVVFYGHRDMSVADLKETYAQPPSAFISMDHMQVHYRDEGNAMDTIPIVLIHGTGASLHTFNAWSARLKKDYRVIRMDLPAFGLTGPFPDGDYSISNYVVFIEHFLASKGIKKCILGGNSIGGEIAWRFTAKNPEMVEKLILIDAAGYPMESKSRPIAFTIARIPVLNKLLTFITPRSMVRSSVENVYADKSKVTDPLVERYFKLTLREGNRQALVDRMTSKIDTNAIQLIKDIRQPTLILWGDQDLLIPVSSAYRFEDDLMKTHLVILKNSGHVPMEENPEESIEAVLEFMRE